MFPTLVPVTLRELATDAVHALDDGWVIDREHVGCNAHECTVFPVKSDIVMLETAICYTLEVPEAAKARKERTWYRAEWGRERLEDEEGDAS